MAANATTAKLKLGIIAFQSNLSTYIRRRLGGNQIVAPVDHFNIEVTKSNEKCLSHLLYHAYETNLAG